MSAAVDGWQLGEAEVRRKTRILYAADRLFSRTDIADNGCHEWRGATNSKGYGVIQLAGPGGGTRILTHRLAWSFYRDAEEIPDGFEVDHVCHTLDLSCAGGRTCSHRRCVNPDHLEAVPAEENRRRANETAAARRARNEQRPAEPTAPVDSLRPSTRTRRTA